MKRKIISVALSLVLIFITAASVSADGDKLSLSSTQVTQAESTNNVSSRSENSSISNHTVYRIRNIRSGKYLNLHYGVDANSTNVYQWTYDGSTEQKWRVSYNHGTDSYQFYSMSSSGGKNRLLNIARNGSSLASGQNAVIWTPVDTLSHELQISQVGSGKYKIYMKGNTNLCLTVNGSSNGTSSGTSSNSAGNVYISAYVGAATQLWDFESTGEIVYGSGDGFLDGVSSIGASGWAWRTDLPNSPIHVHMYIDNLTTQQTWVHITNANIYRADLENAGYGNGKHGYSFSIDWDDYPSGNYIVHTYAISGGNPLLNGAPKSYTNESNITVGTKQTWNYSSYQGSYTPKTGWARPTFYNNAEKYAETYCEFTLDSHNVTNILQYNNGSNPSDDKKLYLTLDISSVRTGNTDQMSAYLIETNLPNPKTDLENDDLLGNRNEEAEVVALGAVESKTYNMSVMWEDFRGGGNDDNGQWQVQFGMSGQYVGTGNLWVQSNGDYNAVYISNLLQAIMPYGKNGGME